MDDLLARIACHSVVRGVHPLDNRQIQELLASMDETDFAASCPHAARYSTPSPGGNREDFQTDMTQGFLKRLANEINNRMGRVSAARAARETWWGQAKLE